MVNPYEISPFAFNNFKHVHVPSSIKWDLITCFFLNLRPGERSGKNLFWSIKNSGEILDKLKARDFNATSLSTYDCSILYTTLPHNLIKDKLIDLIERTFQREGSPYLACNDQNAFFTSEKNLKNIMHGHVKMFVMR